MVLTARKVLRCVTVIKTAAGTNNQALACLPNPPLGSGMYGRKPEAGEDPGFNVETYEK
jgi:hypothetical protein